MLNQSSLLIGKVRFICMAFTCINSLYAVDDVNGGLLILNNNGGWCWYQDERAIVDNGKIILASVAHSSGTGGTDRRGNMEITTYDMHAGHVTRNVLTKIGNDDHNTAAILKRPDGRYLAAYAKHHNDQLMFWNISEPENSTVWGKPKTVSVGANNTYANLFHLTAENRTYNFTRGIGYNPNCMISEDNGDSWSYGGRLMTDKGRPYLKYASNNIDIIHFINSDQHPRDFNNSIYHGYIKEGKVYNSYGKVLDENLFDNKGISVTEPALVYRGGAENVGWTSDLHLDENGNPFAAFSVQMNSAGLPVGEGGEDHRYHYARWQGEKWIEHEIAYAGTKLYSREDDYTGNIALDPDNPGIVFISTDADPETGKQMISKSDGKRHYEMFKGETKDSGATWAWTPITENSTMDNIRPVVPIWNRDSTAFLWMRGTYTSYTNFNTDIVGIIMAEPVTRTERPQLEDALTVFTDNKGLHISFSYAEAYSLTLTDLQGRVSTSLSGRGPDSRMSFENRNSGLYFLTITTVGKRYCRKIVFR